MSVIALAIMLKFFATVKERAQLYGGSFDHGHFEISFRAILLKLELQSPAVAGRSDLRDLLEPDHACQNEDDTENPDRRSGLTQESYP